MSKIEETEGSGEESKADHRFVHAPNKTLLALALPVLLSMVAEPLTGLVDTAFVAKLGAAELAGLGVGTVTLSSIFWIFNFLGIGSQTETAKLAGSGQMQRTSEVGGMALLMALLFGLALIMVLYPLSPSLSGLMGADGEILPHSISYMSIRLFGAPALLLTITCFGILRGLQEMKIPMYIAAGVNLLNLVLDPMFIFGFGIIPPMGVAGSALSTTISQWLGALLVMAAVKKRLGVPERLRREDISKLLKIGGDLFIRTGLLSLFLLLATRAATKIGPEAGAAHQAIRQFWIFTALFLDSFAITGQSLVGFFIGANDIEQARRVAFTVGKWSLITGCILAIAMLLGQSAIASLLVPTASLSAFAVPWAIAALAQPLNSLAFATDGVHWGTGDFAFLRNVMIIATTVGASSLMAAVSAHASIGMSPLSIIWTITALWISIRAIFGVLRIFPGIGSAPLSKTTQ